MYPNSLHYKELFDHYFFFLRPTCKSSLKMAFYLSLYLRKLEEFEDVKISKIKNSRMGDVETPEK